MDFNINTLWTTLWIDQMVKGGVDQFIVSPGYRSAPLVHALIQNPRAKKLICVDERAAAYRALGYAKATGKAAALLCTSGTAMANYFPGVIEASKENLPLIIMSSDRPPELLHSDANQTMDQSKFFGDYHKGFFNFPCPSSQPQEDPLIWAQKIHLGIALAHSLPSGPVHFNFHFREPLAPQVQPLDEHLLLKVQNILERKNPLIDVFPLRPQCPQDALRRVKEIIEGVAVHSHGLMVIGNYSTLKTSTEWAPLRELIERLQWPVLCDIGSSLKHVRLHPHDLMISDFDHPLWGEFGEDNQLRPQVILHLGGPLVGKNFPLLLKRFPHIPYILVNESPLQLDSTHRAQIKITAPPLNFCQELLPALPTRSTNYYLESYFKKVRGHLKEKLAELPFSYLWVAQEIIQMVQGSQVSSGPAIPTGPNENELPLLYIGNSTVIRAFEATIGNNQPFPIPTATHRGVSGIEGFIASACGASEGSGKRTIVVLGDLALLHDLNSLHLLKDLPSPLTVIVINNFSGGIFTRLPLNAFPETLHPFISTPHQWTFSHAAKLFTLDYESAQNKQEFREAFKKALAIKRTSLLIEVFLDNGEDNKVFEQFYQVHGGFHHDKTNAINHTHS